MRIPEIFLGPSAQVSARLRKVLAGVRRGASLQDMLAGVPLADVVDHDGALICLSPGRSGLGGDHFRLDQLTTTVFRKLAHADVNRVREESLEFLASTAWGTIVLNTPQAYFLANDLPLRPKKPSRRAFVAILESTCTHWPTFLGLAERFFSGLQCTFPQALPLSGYVLANCGLDPNGEAGWSNIAVRCRESHLVARLSLDDEFWETVRSGHAQLEGERRTVD